MQGAGSIRRGVGADTYDKRHAPDRGSTRVQGADKCGAQSGAQASGKDRSCKESSRSSSGTSPPLLATEPPDQLGFSRVRSARGASGAAIAHPVAGGAYPDKDSASISERRPCAAQLALPTNRAVLASRSLGRNIADATGSINGRRGTKGGSSANRFGAALDLTSVARSSKASPPGDVVLFDGMGTSGTGTLQTSTPVRGDASNRSAPGAKWEPLARPG